MTVQSPYQAGQSQFQTGDSQIQEGAVWISNRSENFSTFASIVFVVNGRRDGEFSIQCSWT